MVDQQPPAKTEQKQPVPLKVKAAAAVLAAAVAVSPFTQLKEGTKNQTYLDPAKIPTVCTGHTGPEVKLGYARNNIQCAQILIHDQTFHGQAVVNANPELVNDISGLMAATDFAFNSGVSAWVNSPMSRYSKQGQKTKSCNSYIGYYDGASFDKPQRGLECVPHKAKPGKYKCRLPGLVLRRQQEAQICLTGTWH